MTGFPPAAPGWYPLSSVQREVWFDQALYPDTPVYNIGGYDRIRGNIDPKILLQANALLVEETDVLRLVLTEQQGIPLQSFSALPPQGRAFCDCSKESEPLPAALGRMPWADLPVLTECRCPSRHRR